jgi:methylthioribose-1-phosphate isomerase
MEVIQAVRWSPAGDAVRIIDQRLLPGKYVELDLRSVDETCEAIRTLGVRGAPAIGICAAMGIVTAVWPYRREAPLVFRERLIVGARQIRGTRPTAVNLAWAVDRMLALVHRHDGDNASLLAELRAEATAILMEDRAMCERIGEHGAALIPDRARVLTHCNAGALATGGIGTALAPIYHAVRSGKRVVVYADETRPLLQGSRLTAWELSRAGIPVTVIADSAAASLMREGEIDLCIVGADRIAANGDVANKIGTYGLAVLARHHGIPFYVAAPSSTFDPATADGSMIVIEQRSRDEVVRPFGVEVAPDGVPVHNPAFDVTPAGLVSGIVTERGIWEPGMGAIENGEPRIGKQSHGAGMRK